MSFTTPTDNNFWDYNLRNQIYKGYRQRRGLRGESYEQMQYVDGAWSFGGLSNLNGYENPLDHNFFAEIQYWLIGGIVMYQPWILGTDSYKFVYYYYKWHDDESEKYGDFGKWLCIDILGLTDGAGNWGYRYADTLDGSNQPIVQYPNSYRVANKNDYAGKHIMQDIIKVMGVFNGKALLWENYDNFEQTAGINYVGNAEPNVPMRNWEDTLAAVAQKSTGTETLGLPLLHIDWGEIWEPYEEGPPEVGEQSTFYFTYKIIKDGSVKAVVPATCPSGSTFDWFMGAYVDNDPCGFTLNEDEITNGMEVSVGQTVGTAKLSATFDGYTFPDTGLIVEPTYGYGESYSEATYIYPSLIMCRPNFTN